MVDKIEVTPEMHERILKNISEIDFSEPIIKTKSIIRFKKILVLAACFVVLLISTFMIPKIINPEPPIQVVPDIVEYQSLDELSSALGFEVTVPTRLPFEAAQITYFACWKEFAEITYSNDNNTIVFRMAKGKDDVSGDFNQYEDVKEYQTDAGSMTLKGKNNAYTLATWIDDDFSFSISTIQPLSEEEMINMISSVK